MKIGDRVQYYDYTLGRQQEGVVTALEVPVLHMWVWHDGNRLMQSSRGPHRTHESAHPHGVEINGTLTRQYSAVTPVQ